MKKKDIERAAKLFSDFNFVANIQSQLEGSCYHGIIDEVEDVWIQWEETMIGKMIAICEEERVRVLAEYDALMGISKYKESAE